MKRLAISFDVEATGSTPESGSCNIRRSSTTGEAIADDHDCDNSESDGWDGNPSYECRECGTEIELSDLIWEDDDDDNGDDGCQRDAHPRSSTTVGLGEASGKHATTAHCEEVARRGVLESQEASEEAGENQPTHELSHPRTDEFGRQREENSGGVDQRRSVYR